MWGEWSDSETLLLFSIIPGSVFCVTCQHSNCVKLAAATLIPISIWLLSSWRFHHFCQKSSQLLPPGLHSCAEAKLEKLYLFSSLVHPHLFWCFCVLYTFFFLFPTHFLLLSSHLSHKNLLPLFFLIQSVLVWHAFRALYRGTFL